MGAKVRQCPPWLADTVVSGYGTALAADPGAGDRDHPGRPEPDHHRRLAWAQPVAQVEGACPAVVVADAGPATGLPVSRERDHVRRPEPERAVRGAGAQRV